MALLDERLAHGLKRLNRQDVPAVPPSAPDAELACRSELALRAARLLEDALHMHDEPQGLGRDGRVSRLLHARPLSVRECLRAGDDGDIPCGALWRRLVEVNCRSWRRALEALAREEEGGTRPAEGDNGPPDGRPIGTMGDRGPKPTDATFLAALAEGFAEELDAVRRADGLEPDQAAHLIDALEAGLDTFPSFEKELVLDSLFLESQ